MRAGRDRRLGDAVGIVAIVLERPRRVDDDSRIQARQRFAQPFITVEPHRGAAEFVAMRLGALQRAPGHQYLRRRLTHQPARQPAAEHAIAAKDEDALSQ